MIHGMNSAAVGYDSDMKRITITVPDYLYRQIKKRTKPGEVSGFVVGAIQNKVGEDIVKRVIDPWDDFFALRKRLPKFTYRQIRAAINKGRA